MEVVKFKVFTEQEFIDWQLAGQGKRKISQISPLLGGITGDVSQEGNIGMKSQISVFVVYWEEA